MCKGEREQARERSNPSSDTQSHPSSSDKQSMGQALPEPLSSLSSYSVALSSWEAPEGGRSCRGLHCLPFLETVCSTEGNAREIKVRSACSSKLLLFMLAVLHPLCLRVRLKSTPGTWRMLQVQMISKQHTHVQDRGKVCGSLLALALWQSPDVHEGGHAAMGEKEGWEEITCAFVKT